MFDALAVSAHLISIHALLAESDATKSAQGANSSPISIHALLAESDQSAAKSTPEEANFYPRSPCGERPTKSAQGANSSPISIHALLAESDILGRAAVA